MNYLSPIIVHAAPEAPHDLARIRQDKAFGFWLYLMSDLILFALLFATYAVMLNATAGGPDAAQLFDIKRAFLETAALLASSFMFGLAVISAQGQQRERALALLAVTALLGGVFLWLEISEFDGLIAQGAGPQHSGFLSAFFTLVGTHGAHVAMGLMWIAVMSVQMLVKGLTPQVLSRLERLGMFWHFLDIVWIGIFTIVYLPAAIK